MNDTLKRQLLTGIQTSPIIYIEHYHHELISQALMDIIKSKEGQALGLSIDKVCEFDLAYGELCFETKKLKNNTVYDKLDFLVKELCRAKLDYNIFIIRSVDSILSSEEMLSALTMYAQKYERCEIDWLRTVILVGSYPVSQLPYALNRVATIVDVEPPTEADIYAYLEQEKVKMPASFSADEQKRILKQFVRTLQGLQMYELKQVVRIVLNECNHKITRSSVAKALREKGNIVKKSGVIEVCEASGSFAEIGGLDVLKRDIEHKARIYENLSRANDLNIPAPKGCLIIGMPGCGKTMIAKAVANEFNVPLLRLDISRLMGQYVGQSEQNLRMALQTAEAAHPCVLWIDEIEKAFAGSNSEGRGDSDSLVVRLMGHFLTWMQERKNPVYVVATANGVMRPEFMRKGRFDEVYFVDFPNEQERLDILRKKLDKCYSKGNNGAVFDLSDLRTSACKSGWNEEKLARIAKEMCADKGNSGGFSGAEIDNLVKLTFEQKFVDYLLAEKDARENGGVVRPVRVMLNDFLVNVAVLKKNAQCNQKGRKREDGYEMSVIEQIRDIHSRYQFTSASNPTSTK